MSLAEILTNDHGYQIIDTDYLPASFASSGGSSSVATLAYTTSLVSTVLTQTSTFVSWDTLDTGNTYGATTITFNPSNKDKFTNSTAQTIVLQVSCYVIWGAPTNVSSVRAIYAQKNGIDTDRYGYQNIEAGNNFTSSATAFTIVLKPNDWFHILVWHNDTGGGIQVPNSSQHTPNARIIMSQVL